MAGKLAASSMYQPEWNHAAETSTYKMQDPLKQVAHERYAILYQEVAPYRSDGLRYIKSFLTENSLAGFFDKLTVQTC